MQRHPERMAWIFLFNFLLTACASLESPKMKRAYCNELKSEFILGSATSNTRTADIEESEKYLERYNFDRMRCEQCGY